MSEIKVVEFAEELTKESQDANLIDKLMGETEEPADCMPASDPKPETMDLEGVAKELSEELKGLSEVDEEIGDGAEVVEFTEEDLAGIPLPGSTYVEYEEEEPEPEPEPETSWESDRDVAKFMEYIISSYPDKIPQHNGYSTVGCERAYNYLNGLNKEISEALRMDGKGELDAESLEDIRVSIMRDMILLKNRLSQLKKEIREKNSKKKAEENDEGLTKEATTPRIQLVATPFERAIAGILINSVVSAGHPFEEVYDYLKEKYELSDRDELAILQLVMDSGFHIFKDRGVIGEGEGRQKGKDLGHGIDFIKNYFA